MTPETFSPPFNCCRFSHVHRLSHYLATQMVAKPLPSPLVISQVSPTSRAEMLLLLFLLQLTSSTATFSTATKLLRSTSTRSTIDPFHGRPSAPIDECSSNGCCCCINMRPGLTKTPKSTTDIPCSIGTPMGSAEEGWAVVFCKLACTSSWDGVLLNGIEEDFVNNAQSCPMHCEQRFGGLSRCPPGMVIDEDSSTEECISE